MGFRLILHSSIESLAEGVVVSYVGACEAIDTRGEGGVVPGVGGVGEGRDGVLSANGSG